MEWLNLHISTLRTPEFIGSNPVARSTWLCVLAYSVEQENSGRIVGGASWKDRQWQQTCGVTLREVRAADKLLAVDGQDIVVNGYPVAKEAKVRQARGVALAGAMARWGKKGAAVKPAEPDADPMPTGMPDGNAEGKGREGKGRSPAPATAGITTWIRTSTSSHERTQENQQALAGLINRFGAPVVQRIAEQLVFQRGGKIWPDDKDLLAQLVASVAPKAAPIEQLPDDLNELPDDHPMKPKPKKFKTPIPFPVQGEQAVEA
jgi:hypothetical protein